MIHRMYQDFKSRIRIILTKEAPWRATSAARLPHVEAKTGSGCTAQDKVISAHVHVHAYIHVYSYIYTLLKILTGYLDE